LSVRHLSWSPLSQQIAAPRSSSQMAAAAQVGCWGCRICRRPVTMVGPLSRCKDPSSESTSVVHVAHLNHSICSFSSARRFCAHLRCLVPPRESRGLPWTGSLQALESPQPTTDTFVVCSIQERAGRLCSAKETTGDTHHLSLGLMPPRLDAPPHVIPWRATRVPASLNTTVLLLVHAAGGLPSLTISSKSSTVAAVPLPFLWLLRVSIR
jgi:hypothetical protein